MEIKTKYLEEGDIWVAWNKELGMSVLGKTELEVLEGMEEAITSHLNKIQIGEFYRNK